MWLKNVIQLCMKYEIDQSGKIEDTAKDTVVAYCNGDQRVIVFKARDKRSLQEIFRRSGQIRLFIYRTFATLIFLLIKENLKSENHFEIDTEYDGQEKIIKDILLEYIRAGQLEEPRIHFSRIGSKPKVHYAAYDVLNGKKKPDKIVDFKDVAILALRRIKKDRGHKD